MGLQLAKFPIAGSQPAATIAIHPLLCAQMLMPPNWFHRKPGVVETLKAFGVGVSASEQELIPVPAYLLEHPQAGLVLVDTGMHASLAQRHSRERVRNLGPVGSVMSRHTIMRTEQTAAAQLLALGIDTADVSLIVMTHLHFDHASALCDFPNATVLVDEREWRAAWARGSSLSGYSTSQLDPRPQYRMIDFTAASVLASGPFERAVDVFGDGALTLVSTPGHTAGHLSLIVRTQAREVLLSADAAYTLGTIRAGERPFLTHNRSTFEHSLHQIQTYDRDNPDALIIPGHDMSAWTDACNRMQGRAVIGAAGVE
jgi:N-acyl homoserine lactone hydrolase